MPITLTEADLDLLGDAETAAVRRRYQWIKDARMPRRGGKQLPPEDLDWQIFLMRAGRGFGKLLPVSEPIPTPAGWTTMGELQVEDQVFDESGRVCNVTWASPIEIPDEAYRLELSDGSHMDACADHQWVTWTHAERKAFLRSPYEDTTRFPPEWPAWRLKRRHGRVPISREVIERTLELVLSGMTRAAATAVTGICSTATYRHERAGGYIESAPRVYPDTPGPRVRTTRDIVQSLTYGLRGDVNHCIPQALPLQLPDVALPIPPYTLGAWLGDGTSRAGAFTSGVDDINEMRARIEADGFPTICSAYDPMHFGATGLQRLLRINGLLLNKHVPSVYFRASIRQRLELLRGLMDTDGGNDNANLVSFTNTNKRLADAVQELVVSLGMRVQRDDRIPRCGNTGKLGKRAYRVAFTPTEQVFSLQRKANRVSYTCGQLLRRRHRMIVDAQPIQAGPMRCIEVDSLHHTYLAGREMVPTHNSAALYQWAWWEAWREPGIIVHVVAPTLGDLRTVSFEGPVGLNSLVPPECLRGGCVEKAYNKSTHELFLSNGSRFLGFGAIEEGSRMRGPQCHALVGDEIAQWDRPAGNLEQAMSNALFGLRLNYPDGTPSRAVMGTTPRPIPFLKRFEKRAGVRVVTGTSYENLDNLSASYRTQLLSLAGTQIGKQEIDALFLDDESDVSIFKRSWIKLWPADRKLPEFSYILISMDTAFGEHNFDLKKQTTDPTACIVLGVFNVCQVFDEAERKKLGIATLPGRSRNGVLLCDAWDERLGFPDLLEKARSQYRVKWGSPGRRADVMLIEQKSSGISLRQTLAQYQVPTWPYNPGSQSKTQRAHAVSPLLAQGLLFVPESGKADRRGLPRDWVEPMLDQVCAFAGPGSVEHDDYVDTLTSGLLYMRDRGMLTAQPRERYVDLEQKLAEDREEAAMTRELEKTQVRGNPYA